MGMLDPVLSSYLAHLDILFDDGNYIRDVTWKRFKESVYDETEGVNVEAYDDFDLQAVRIDKEIGVGTTARQYPPGSWKLPTGDVLYVFKTADLPDDIGTRDLIVDGPLQYGVERINPSGQVIMIVDVRGYA